MWRNRKRKMPQLEFILDEWIYIGREYHEGALREVVESFR